MEKVDSEKQDNTLDDTVDYNESTTTTSTTSISVSIRIEKKKLKREIKKVAKETTKFLNSSSKNNDSIKVFKDMPGFKYDYKRLFIKHECSAYKETIV
jgi:hypothetical protein